MLRWLRPPEEQRLIRFFCLQIRVARRDGNSALAVLFTPTGVAGLIEPVGNPQVTRHVVGLEFKGLCQFLSCRLSLAGVVERLSKIPADKWIKRVDPEQVPIQGDNS